MTTITDLHVYASVATPTTKGVVGGLDVDFTLTLGGVEYEGDVVLLPHEDGRPGYSSWGDADHWLDGRTVTALRALPLDDAEYRAVLSAISAACAEECYAV